MHKITENQVTAASSRHLIIVLDFLIPLSLMALFAAFIDARALDLAISAKWHNHIQGWFGGRKPLANLIYDYGTLPALCLSIYALYSYIRSFFVTRLQAHRKKFLYLVLVMIIGPGLVVNVGLKQQWGRPRPRDIQDFGGKYSYEAPWQMDRSSPGNSFPSGHASMGFYFFSLLFLVRNKSWKQSLWSGILAFAWGAIIGFVRIIQGGHFFTDVLWAAVILWLICALIYYVMTIYGEADKLNWTKNTEDISMSSSK